VGKRVADDLRLLMNLLGHEMTIVAFFGKKAARRASLNATLNRLAGRVANGGAFARQHDPVAFFEVGHAVGEWRERKRVRAHIHLAVAIADRQRRAFPRADQQIVLPLEKIDESEGAAQPPERRVNRLRRRLALPEFVLDDKCRDLGIRLGRKRIAPRDELFAQSPEVLDDAVVNDREPARGMRMRIRFRRLAVRRPPGVPDAD
jgi:hypothetical protein